MIGPPTSSSNNKGILVLVLLSVIGLSLLTLSMLATIASAQPSSNSMPGSSSTNSIGSSDTTVKEMGICQVGVKSPCNGNSVE